MEGVPFLNFNSNCACLYSSIFARFAVVYEIPEFVPVDVK
jgi:hypothetical protein